MPVANTSNISTIQILRSYANSTPTTLDDGQLAYSFVSNTLFIGSNTGVKIIGDPSTAVKSQAAYDQANTATVLANAAYFHANGAFLKANAAFDNSNTKLSLSGGTITGPIRGSGESKLDFTTYGPNTAYLTTTNDDSTALFMGAMSAELYANTNVQIRTNTKATSQNWTFGEDGSLTFPDNTIQTTAYVPNDEVDNVARALAQSAYNQANVTVGVDATQNTRLTIIDGVDVSQNVRLDYSNTAITIIQGVDVGQNNRMAISDGVNASQNSRLDFSNTRMTIIEGVDVGQNTRLTVSEGVDLSQNVRIDYSNTALTIAQGVDNSQNVRIDYSNTAITIIQGVDVGQNSRMTIADGVDASQNVRLNYSNAAITIIQGVDVTQNTRLTVSDGVNLSQNVRLDFSNTRMNIIDGVNAGQNARMTIIEGVDVTQNTNISNRLALSGASLQTVTGNVVFGNDVTVTGNLIVLGNTISLNVTSLEVKDTLIQLGIGNYSTDVLTIGYVGHYNDGTNAHAGMIRDAVTKEFYAFQGYTPEASGNVINVNDASFTKANIHGNWFKGNLIATTARVGGLDVNSRLDFSNTRMTIIEGVDVTQNTNIAATDNKMQGAYNVANTADVRSVAAYFHANGAFIKANAAFDQANVTIGVDASQNSRMTIIEGTDLSQNVRIDYSNTALTIAQGVDNSQNVRIDFSNTAITIIQGVDATQNTRLTVIEGTDVSQNARMVIIEGVDVGQNTRMAIADGVDASQNVRLDYSNTAITIIQGVDSGQNSRMTIIEGTDTSQNARMTIIEGTDTSQNSRMTITDGVDASQNVRLDYSNTAITIIQGVDSGQNARMTIIEGTDTSQNARMVIIEGTDTSQNARMTIIEGTNASQNVRLNFSNTAINQVSSSWTANTVIVANSSGYLSNSAMSFNSSTSHLHSMANLSIGTSTASAPLTISKSFTLPTASEQFGQFNSITYNVADTNLKQGLRLNTVAQHTSGNITDLASILNLCTAGGVGGTTASQYNFWARNDVAAGAFVTNSYNYFSNNGASSGNANNQFGFYTANLTKGLLGNYGFYGAVNTGNNAFNLYMAGTAPNYLAGSLTVANNIPSTSNTTGSLVVTGGLGVSGNTFFNNSLAAVTTTTSAVNYLQVTGNTAGGGPVLSAQGSDANIDLVLFPKANGNVQVIGSSTVSRIYSRTFDNNYNTLIETNYDTNQGLNIYNTGSLVLRHGSGSGLILNYVNGNTNFQYRGTSQLSINGANSQVSILGPTVIQNTAASISNTTGALIVRGGLGLSGNLSMNLASSGSGVSRLTLSPRGYFSNYDTSGNIIYDGGGFLFNNSLLYVQNQLLLRGPISNDQGNNTILFGGSSPVLIQNTAASTSNTTGALVIQGGVGVSGNIYVGGTNASANGIYTDNLRYAANGLPWVMGSGGGGGSGLPTTAFSRVVISGQPDAIANIANSPLTLVAGSGISLATNGVANSITISTTGGGGGGNVSASGYTANTILTANSGGFLSSSNSFFVASNNAIVTPNVVITQAATASFPLSFGQGLGNKIGLYDDGSSGVGYGFGIQSNKLQIFHKTSGDHTSFGHGSSSGFTEQFRVAGVASAVNYLQVSGNTTGATPTVTSSGSDTDVGQTFFMKGAGKVSFYDGQAIGAVSNPFRINLANTQFSSVIGVPSKIDFYQGNFGFGLSAGQMEYLTTNGNYHTFFGQSQAKQFAILATGSAVNHLQVTGATSTNSPILSAQGSSANVAINLVPKGNGAVMITGNTTSTINVANSLYVGGVVGFANANNISVVYQSYNSSTNSLDVVFG